MSQISSEVIILHEVAIISHKEMSLQVFIDVPSLAKRNQIFCSIGELSTHENIYQRFCDGRRDFLIAPTSGIVIKAMLQDQQAECTSVS